MTRRVLARQAALRANASLRAAADHAESVRGVYNYDIDRIMERFKANLCDALNASSDLLDQINRIMAKAIVVAIILLATASAAGAQYYPPQNTSPGAMPYVDLPPTTSDVPPPRLYLMPDGGTWQINPPATDGFFPPPIYTPPPTRYEDRGFHYGNRPSRRR
jgi:hypothetical protein